MLVLQHHSVLLALLLVEVINWLLALKRLRNTALFSLSMRSVLQLSCKVSMFLREVLVKASGIQLASFLQRALIILQKSIPFPRLLVLSES